MKWQVKSGPKVGSAKKKIIFILLTLENTSGTLNIPLELICTIIRSLKLNLQLSGAYVTFSHLNPKRHFKN